jgi:DNA-binding transcriptional ArsR family regulator
MAMPLIRETRSNGARLTAAAARLEALGNTTRLGVFRMLVRAGDDGLPVGQLQMRLMIAASTLSHHLRVLIAVGLVSQERRKTTLVCRANFTAMQALISYLADECCADAKDEKRASPKGRQP